MSIGRTDPKDTLRVDSGCLTARWAETPSVRFAPYAPACSFVKDFLLHFLYTRTKSWYVHSVVG